MGLFSRKKSKKLRPETEDPQFHKVKLGEEGKTIVDKDVQPKTSQTPRIASRLIIRPLLTEKATQLQESRQYVFVVDHRANKAELKKEVERLFGVRVQKINIIHKKRKRRVWRGRAGFSPGLKKAIITVVEGDKIEVLPH